MSNMIRSTDINATSKDVIKLPSLKLTNFKVTSGSEDVLKVGNIYWININKPFAISALVEDEAKVLEQVNLAQGKEVDDVVMFMTMIERIVKQPNGQISVVGDLRYAALLQSMSMEMESSKGFTETGNYVITAERLNMGLEEIGAPFRIEMDKLEFDVINE